MVDLRRFKIVLTVQTGPKLDPDVNRRPLGGACRYMKQDHGLQPFTTLLLA
jgi:hypothetical protein